MAFAVVPAGIAVVEQRSRDRRIAELHDGAREAADAFEPPAGLAEHERTELVASRDRNREFGNVRITLGSGAISPDPSAIVDDVTMDFCGPSAQPVVETGADTFAVAYAIPPEVIVDVLIPSVNRLRAAGCGAGTDIVVTFRYDRAGEMPGRQDLDLTC